MNVECFLDTNILVYAAAGSARDAQKRRAALDLLQGSMFATSTQVLQEFYVTVTRKLSPAFQPETALEWMDQFEAFPCVTVDRVLIRIGVEISQRYQVSYWDGLIVAAAEASGAEILLTEDLNHNQRYSKLVARNPFLSLAD